MGLSASKIQALRSKKYHCKSLSFQVQCKQMLQQQSWSSNQAALAVTHDRTRHRDAAGLTIISICGAMQVCIQTSQGLWLEQQGS